MFHQVTCLFVLFVCINYVYTKDFLPVTVGVCPRPVIKGELDVNRFFHGKWYVQKSMGFYLFQVAGSCATTVANITEDGQRINLLHYQYDNILKTYVKIKGTAETKFTKFLGIYSPVKYDAFGDGFVNVEVPIVILDTDYDNWAIVYMCKQFHTGFKSELGWMMSRRRTDKTSLKTMQSSQSLVNNDRFENEKNTNCPPDEPDL